MFAQSLIARRFRSSIFLAVLAGGVSFSAQANFNGAIYTSFKDTLTGNCTTVNANIYSTKEEVGLNGGPINANAAGLPANTSFYVKVTGPDGDLLGTSLNNNPQTGQKPVTTDSTGRFVSCYRLYDIVTLPDSSATGFLDTPNAGGVYKVWISTDPDFSNDLSKTDNFRIGGTVPPQDVGRITIRKFYDANTNGVMDVGEVEVLDWKVDLNVREPKLTIATYDLLADGAYLAREYNTYPMTNWYSTVVTVNNVPTASAATPTPQILNSVNLTLTSPSDNNKVVWFGNVCTGAGGGLTLGFWSNKNGEKAINAMVSAGKDPYGVLRYLNLRNADDSNFDPTSFKPLNSWLLNGKAVNMAYMLSVQLAAMQLNVLNGNVVGSSLIYAMGTTSANAGGFATVNAVIAEANAALALPYSSPFPGVSVRTYQEALKNALDNANNDRWFVQSAPCEFAFAP